jgi:two-component system, OmpR family, sensor histidine kinase BaeS
MGGEVRKTFGGGAGGGRGSTMHRGSSGYCVARGEGQVDLKRLLRRSPIVPAGMPPEAGGRRAPPAALHRADVTAAAHAGRHGAAAEAEAPRESRNGADRPGVAGPAREARLRRTWDVRARLVAAMVGVAVVAVLLATVASDVGVDNAVERFGREDLQLSADHTAAVAGDFYMRRGRWAPADVREVVRLEKVQGQTVVVRDGAGRVVPGSTVDQAKPRAVAPVRVSGRTVGTISLAHVGGGYLRVLSDELQNQLRSHYLVAGLIVAVLAALAAMMLAFALAEPVRRLTRAAARLEAGDLDAEIDGGTGSAEFRQLARTMARLAVTLKREEETRRETISDLAHELRTPMAGLRGRIEAAQDGVLTDIPALLASMHADVLRLGRLMEDVESLARAQQPGLLMDRKPVNLAELARARARAFEEYYRTAGIRFFADIEPVSTMGDAERLGQIIDNLLSNALRYTDEGGRVILRVLAGRTQAIIEVADTGVGISPEDLPRVFDRFWRAEKSRSRATGGSGLGLALVQELVRAHDGRIDVESMAGRGSRFRVHLPIAGAEEQTLVDLREHHQAGAFGDSSVCVARLRRDVLPSEWRSVERQLLASIREGVRLLAFELDDHTTLDAQSVTTLTKLRAELEGRGGHFVLVGREGSDARASLQACDVDRVLMVVGDVQQAAALLVREHVSSPADR